ncbi:MAG: sulfurtransferase [Lautropia sp.]
MRWNTLITAEELAAAIDRCVVVDCRHDLLDAGAGLRAYEEGHIPSAHYLNMDRELSGPKSGRNGRHPMPDREALIDTLRAIGLSDDRQLVAYDAQGGQMAGRLWCLARWIGHEAVAVLDGDMRAWQAAGYPLAQEHTPRPATKASLSTARRSLLPTIDVQQLQRGMAASELFVIDARAPDRYSGAIEQIDPVAGHIPGALNRFYGRNLRPDGRFKPAEALQAEFATLLDGRAPATVVHQCGSGVTACLNLLAMEHAGLSGSRLYPGSWSEWIADPARPVATGAG